MGQLIDARSLELHRIVANKLLSDPAIIDLAKTNLNKWHSSQAYREWEVILQKPATEIASFLVDTSERATRMRKSSPFAGALSEKERLAVYEAHRS